MRITTHDMTRAGPATLSSAPDRVSQPTFRDQFPALDRFRWFGTPGCCPAARPVTAAMRGFIDRWEDGTFDWCSWEDEAERSRRLFADMVGSSSECVSLHPSLSSAAATVARSVLPRLGQGEIVIAANEFRSTAMPWSEAATSGQRIRLVDERPGENWTDRLVAAITPSTILVALSEVQSATGARARVADVLPRCRHVGARLFINTTQSTGVLDTSPAILAADYFATHGYKWLLAPRGAAWLHVRPDRAHELGPLAPNWKNCPGPRENMYGLPAPLANDATRLDTSLGWCAWVGAASALDLISSLSPAAVEQHCVALADAMRHAARTAGWSVSETGEPSPIVCVSAADAQAVVRRLAASRVVATARAGRVRFGCHYFNSLEDIDVAVGALGRPA